MASDRTREAGFKLVNELNEKCSLVDLEGKNLGFDPDEAYELAAEFLDAFERETLERAATHVPVACEATRFGRNPEYFIECTCGWNLNGKICRGVGDHGLWEAHIRELAAQPTPEVKK